MGEAVGQAGESQSTSTTLAVNARIGETPHMKKALKSLPASKRRELDQAVEILTSSFAEAISTRKAERLKHGRILKIILFGSYARGDWVEDPVGRYFSDFDLLIVVDHEDLAEPEFWAKAEQRLLSHSVGQGAWKTPVSIIVHSLDDVNHQLERGRYFFIDIVRDGIVLMDTGGVVFREPKVLDDAVALSEARRYFKDWLESSASFQRSAGHSIADGDLKLAAFHLHQTAEHLYHGLLLVLTLYSPKSHKIIALRRMSEALVPELTEVWPADTKFKRRAFELLRAAYVKARYSPHYRITTDELAWLMERVGLLREKVTDACVRHLAMVAERVSPNLR